MKEIKKQMINYAEKNLRKTEETDESKRLKFMDADNVSMVIVDDPELAGILKGYEQTECKEIDFSNSTKVKISTDYLTQILKLLSKSKDESVEIAVNNREYPVRFKLSKPNIEFVLAPKVESN